MLRLCYWQFTERLWSSPPSSLFPLSPALSASRAHASFVWDSKKKTVFVSLIKGILFCCFLTTKNLCNNLSVYLAHMFPLLWFLKKKTKEKKKKKKLQRERQSAQLLQAAGSTPLKAEWCSALSQSRQSLRFGRCFGFGWLFLHIFFFFLYQKKKKLELEVNQEQN